jgi:hypothetical protein
MFDKTRRQYGLKMRFVVTLTEIVVEMPWMQQLTVCACLQKKAFVMFQRLSGKIING